MYLETFELFAIMPILPLFYVVICLCVLYTTLIYR